MKPVIWAGGSADDVRAFPTIARQRAGYELYRLQQGLDPSDWKPMRAVGAGAREIRIYSALEHRVIYVAKFNEAVYVLHAFEKRARQTRQADIELARARLRNVVAMRERMHVGTSKE